MTLLHPARHETPLHDLWSALLAALAAPAPRQPHPHLMTDPDVFDVFGEDDAA
jgi:hypothetical protein